MTEHEGDEAMNRAIRGTDKPPEEMLNSHEQLAVEGLRQGVEPTLASDLWRLVGPAADLEPNAEIDVVGEVAEIKRRVPQIFDDEQTAWNRTLRREGLGPYTSVPTSRPARPGDANGGVRPIPESPKTMSDRIRQAFENRRSSGRGNGWEA